jgi:hypothetical protein
MLVGPGLDDVLLSDDLGGDVASKWAEGVGWARRCPHCGDRGFKFRPCPVRVRSVG